jgi:hypothetical protein
MIHRVRTPALATRGTRRGVSSHRSRSAHFGRRRCRTAAVAAERRKRDAHLRCRLNRDTQSQSGHPRCAYEQHTHERDTRTTHPNGTPTVAAVDQIAQVATELIALPRVECLQSPIIYRPNIAGRRRFWVSSSASQGVQFCFVGVQLRWSRDRSLRLRRPPAALVSGAPAGKLRRNE